MEPNANGAIVGKGIFNLSQGDLSLYCGGMSWNSMCQSAYAVSCAFQVYEKTGWNRWKAQAEQCGCPIQ